MGGISIDLWVVYAFLFASVYFEVFLLTSFIELRFRKIGLAVAKEIETLPSVAIIVPCFNEEKTVESTMHSLLALKYPADKLEFIIVDDGSTDNTAQKARKFESNPRVKFFSKKNGGKHTAMNLGLKHTSAELVGCLDADSVVEPEALMAIVPVFEKAEVAAATPGIHVKNPKTVLQHMQHVEYRLSIFNRFMLAALGSAFITPGPFSLFRTTVVRELGGWKHGHSTEDMEMALRVQQAGFLIANVPTAIVHTSTPSTIRGLFHQRVRWTYGWLRNAVDYRSMFGNPQYGNLGIMILPSAIISIFAGIFFFVRIVYFSARSLTDIVSRTWVTGIYPHASFDIFYFNTSTLWFIIYLSVALIFALLCAGTMIGTDKHLPPPATPLFLLFYSFLVPLWLGTAVFRAAFKSDIRWR